jgi:hypothetical protein
MMTRITDEHLEGSMQISTEIKPDSEGVQKQKQCDISFFSND